MKRLTQPHVVVEGLTQYDLVAKRYVASALANEESAWKFNRTMKARDFTPGALRRMGD
ncbi:MAG TPA: hypothetical protein VLJ57_12860 [Burkholderiaceae bacterium]|nr:hypothetical protein [Burkholderiaceae bacterium]